MDDEVQALRTEMAAVKAVLRALIARTPGLGATILANLEERRDGMFGQVGHPSDDAAEVLAKVTELLSERRR